MSRYILIQSKSPWESGDVGHFYALARELGDRGEVTFFLVQNGVMAPTTSRCASVASTRARSKRASGRAPSTKWSIFSLAAPRRSGTERSSHGDDYHRHHGSALRVGEH